MKQRCPRAISVAKTSKQCLALGNKWTGLGCPIHALSFMEERLDALCICNILCIG